MSLPSLIALALAAGWIAAACAVPFLRSRHREPAQWLLVGVCVPLLGWATLRLGPGAGVLAGAAAAAVLLRPPFRAGGRWRRDQGGA